MNNVSSREVQQQLIALVNKGDLASELFRGAVNWLLQANACFQPNLGWKHALAIWHSVMEVSRSKIYRDESDVRDTRFIVQVILC